MKVRLTYLDKVTIEELEEFLDRIINCEKLNYSLERIQNYYGAMTELIIFIKGILKDKELKEWIKTHYKQILDRLTKIYDKIIIKEEDKVNNIEIFIIKELKEIIGKGELEKDKKIKAYIDKKEKKIKNFEIIYKIDENKISSLAKDIIKKTKKDKVYESLTKYLLSFLEEMDCLKGLFNKKIDKECMIEKILDDVKIKINKKEYKIKEFNKIFEKNNCYIDFEKLENQKPFKEILEFFDKDFIKKIKDKNVKKVLERFLVLELTKYKSSKFNISITKILGVNERKELKKLVKYLEKVKDEDEEKIIKKLEKQDEDFLEDLLERVSKVIFYYVGYPSINFFKDFYNNEKLQELFYEYIEKELENYKDKEKIIKALKVFVKEAKKEIIEDGISYIPIREINKKKFVKDYGKEFYYWKITKDYLINKVKEKFDEYVNENKKELINLFRKYVGVLEIEESLGNKVSKLRVIIILLKELYTIIIKIVVANILVNIYTKLIEIYFNSL